MQDILYIYEAGIEDMHDLILELDCIDTEVSETDVSAMRGREIARALSALEKVCVKVLDSSERKRFLAMVEDVRKKLK